jgi:nitrile hydratase accessory protein
MDATAAEALAQISAAGGDELPLPPPSSEQVFAAPWQAQLFAMTVTLHERGLFTWREWAQALGRHVSDDMPDGSGYYERWADALAEMLWTHGVATEEDIAQKTRAWQEAAARTPHGMPIEL